MLIHEAALGTVLTKVLDNSVGVGATVTLGKPGPPGEPAVGSRIDLLGAPNVSLTLLCAESTARLLAAELLGEPAAGIGQAQAADAVAELLNMAAGHLKLLLPERESRRLSCPQPFRGGEPAPAGKQNRICLTLTWRGRPIAVELVQLDAAG